MQGIGGLQLHNKLQFIINIKILSNLIIYMSLTETVKPKNSLTKVSKESNLFILIIDEIKKLYPDYPHLKFNVEIYEQVLQLIVRNTKVNYKVDIEQLALKILNALFNFTIEELQTVQNQIKYLLDNNIIKKVPILTKVYNSSKNLIKKNLPI